jgi:hypothetical protein
MENIAVLYNHKMTRFFVEQSFGFHCDVESYDSIESFKKGSIRTSPDVLVCEINDGGIDVRDLFSDIPELLPIVFISSRKKNEEKRKNYLQDKHYYLSIPYLPEDILNAARLVHLNSQQHALIKTQESKHT